MAGLMEVGGVEPPSPGAYRGRLQVYRAYRFVGEGAADPRAFPPVSRNVSPRPSGPKRGLASVGYEPCGRSRRRDRGPGLRYLRSESVVVVVGN
jgi:hypothetical protein